jgi:hypothetical protein
VLIRVLSEWPGSPPCGTVSAVPDDVAVSRIAQGFAERVHVPETTMVAAPETAMRPKGRGRRA